MRCPYRHKAYELLSNAERYNETQVKLPDGLWYPVRPIGFSSWTMRLINTWAVFTGRADILIWEGQEK